MPSQRTVPPTVSLSSAVSLSQTKPFNQTPHFGTEAGPIKPSPPTHGAVSGDGGAGGTRRKLWICELRDVQVELDLGAVRCGGGEGGKGGELAVCFWLYLPSSAGPSSVILHQVAENVTRLHIDGDLVDEAHLCSLFGEADSEDDACKVCFVGNNDKVEGYVYNTQVLSMLGTMQEQYTKNPPCKLSIDYSCCDGFEEGSDGIWNIVGGKASCRRNFILEVVLLNAFGEPVNNDTQIVASLVYADNGAAVEKSRDDAEPPLLLAIEGFECPAKSRPLPIIRGRALFKLKIFQAAYYILN